MGPVTVGHQLRLAEHTVMLPKVPGEPCIPTLGTSCWLATDAVQSRDEGTLSTGRCKTRR
jgi:hypothetical protein